MIRFRPPGDKSISHRAVLLAPLAASDSTLRSVSGGADVRSSISVMEHLGARLTVVPGANGGLTLGVAGSHPLAAPDGPLDCGNSGTTARLLAGILAGSGLTAVLDGDSSLRARPMRRIVYPLQAMGGRIEYMAEPERLPIRFLRRASGSLRPLRHRSRVASAQVKSAVLLAGLTGRVRVEVTEPGRSRDHTERLLAAMGAPVVFDPLRVGAGSVRLDPDEWDGELKGLDLDVPGDPSAAAFLIGAALLAGRAIHIVGVGANPGRIAYLDVLAEMGAAIDRTAVGESGGEPVESWTVAPPERLRPFSVGGDRIPGLIDELPLLGVLAARAEGRSEIRDAAELRVKESDRLAGLAGNLDGLGITVAERSDGIVIDGRSGRLEGSIHTGGDHRLAMAFGSLAAGGGADLVIDDPDCAAVSFPGFWDALGPFQEARHAARSAGTASRRDPVGRGSGRCEPEGRVIAIDGLAASGKSTTARAVAERLGFVHVNSGLFYRAVTWWAIERGLDESSPTFAARVERLDVGLTPTAGGGYTVAVNGATPGAALQAPEVTARVSAVSTVPAVRALVLERLRAAAVRDLVCDGRDIGTTVFPGAPLKVFLVAAADERARRRLSESARPTTPDAVAREAERLRARDDADASRELSPLRRAHDAVEIDTTALTPDEVVDAIVSLARERGLA